MNMAIKSIILDKNTVIYIEMNDVEVISGEDVKHCQEFRRGERGIASSLNSVSQQVMQNAVSLQETIKSFAVNALDSFREIANANVDKVTLEFGINIGGEMGIPYVTKGSVGSNLKITVECSFK
jgi:hypothetical protein